MSSKIKSIIIIVVIIAAIVLAYVLFFPKASDQGNLTSSPIAATSSGTNAGTSSADTPVDPSFLSLLLSVKGLTLNDAIFTNIAFTSLRDSTIILPTGTTDEGRINPFAPIGSDTLSMPVSPDLSPLDSANQTSGTVNNTTGSQSGVQTPKKN